MCTTDQLQAIISQMRDALQPLFPGQALETILFGSYARNQADDSSDIDLLFLVDAPRETISKVNWEIGNAAADLLLDHGIVVSPIVENRSYFRDNARTLPFFRTIQQEGVRISA